MSNLIKIYKIRLFAKKIKAMLKTGEERLKFKLSKR